MIKAKFSALNSFVNVIVSSIDFTAIPAFIFRSEVELLSNTGSNALVILADSVASVRGRLRASGALGQI